MLRFACAVAILSAAISGPALASDNPSGAADPAKSEKKICKNEAKTGSIMPKRVCRTKAEWDQLSEQGKADLDRVRDMDRSRSMVGSSR